MHEITTENIIYLFEEAVRTDRRLPRVFKKTKITAKWIETKIEEMYKHSYHKTEFKIIPSSNQIDRWWIASELLRLIIEDIDSRKLNWARAKRISFAQLGRMFGYSRFKVKEKWLDEITYIRLWLQLHQKNKKINDMIDKIVDKR